MSATHGMENSYYKVAEDTSQVAQLNENTLSVLLVEDDPLVRTRLAEVISKAGFVVHTATSAEEALYAFSEEFFPIAIVDRLLGTSDGMDLTRQIRDLPWPGYVYVMLLTVLDSSEQVVAGLNAGADDYLSKKVTDAELVARLKTASRIITLEQSLRDTVAERSRAASTDVLTGGHNRRYFARHIKRELKRARRFGTPLSMLLLDIDHFKQVNDRYGHGAGDEILKQFSNRIRYSLPRDCDWSARIGGEEFAVVLPQTDLAGAKVVAERLRKAVCETPFQISHGDLTITVSQGVSALSTLEPDIEQTAQAMLDQADHLLYRSKIGGRNQVCCPTAREH
jgi:two-component system, cell cycle response regulator